MSVKNDIESGSGTPPEKREYYYDRRSSGPVTIQYVPQSFGDTIGSPVSKTSRTLHRLVLTLLETALAIGAFATTLTTLSCTLMGFRGLSNTDVFVADFNFVYVASFVGK